MAVYFVITKYTSYQASCVAKYYYVHAYTRGGLRQGRWCPEARTLKKGLFHDGFLENPGAKLAGAVKMFRRPLTRLVDIMAYLKTMGEVEFNPKDRVGIRQNCLKLKPEALKAKFGKVAFSEKVAF